MTDIKRLKPVNRHISIVPHFKEEKTDSGVILPDDFKQEESRFIKATVIDIASDCKRDFHDLKYGVVGPKEVVIDEFSGQLIASSAAGISPLFNIVAFILFRIFDIFKPGIISKAEKLDGAIGIMLDDWLAGIFSAAILFLFFFLGFIKYNWFLFWFC